MYYGKIRENDIANGTGVRVSLFVSGCRNHCKNCFQPETWDFKYGQEYTPETEQYIINKLSPPYIQGLSILGGEPFEPENQPTVLELLRRVKSELPDKNIWCYTGFTIEELISGSSRGHCEITNELLSLIDILVDGRYEDSLRDISLAFKGSSNQRIINIKSNLSFPI